MTKKLKYGIIIIEIERIVKNFAFIHQNLLIERGNFMALNLQDQLKAAKLEVQSILQSTLDEKFDKVGDFSWAILAEGDGFSRFVELKLVAKKDYDLDEAIEEYEFNERLKAEKKTKKK